MLKKIIRRFKKNPLDEILKKAKEQKSKTFLLPWNRALGDISLGLYYVVNKIKKEIPDSKITFLIREDLKAGFELLGGINYITVSFWRRYVPIDIYHAMKLLNIKESSYDVILKEVDREIVERFYGCGSPIPPLLNGCTVLDLGCGTGRDVFIASKLVGENGYVIGVDMTDEQLSVGRRYVDDVTKKFDFRKQNIDFRLGYIEDLKSLCLEDESVDFVI